MPNNEEIKSIDNRTFEDSNIIEINEKKDLNNDKYNDECDLYYDEEDYEKLSKLSEKEREMILFKRSEGVRKYRQLKNIEQIKAKESEEHEKKRIKPETEDKDSLDKELTKEFELVEKQSTNEKIIKNLNLADFQKLFINRNMVLKILKMGSLKSLIGSHIFYYMSGGYKIGKITEIKEGKEYTIGSPSGLIKCKDLIVVRDFKCIKKFGVDIISNKSPELKDFEKYKIALCEYLNSDSKHEYNLEKLLEKTENIKKILKNKIPEKIQRKQISNTQLTKKQIVKKKIELRTKINKAELRDDYIAVQMLEKQYEALLTEEDKEVWAPLNTNRPRLECNKTEEIVKDHNRSNQNE